MTSGRKSYTFSKGIKRSAKADRMYDGVVFSSKSEMKRWIHLRQLEREGKIKNLKRQINFKLILPNGVPVRVGRSQQVARYTLDHQYDWYSELNGRMVTVYEDVKQFMTPDARLRIGIFEAIYGIKVEIVKK